MAKGTPGKFKQDQVISQFERLNRKAEWEKRNPHLRELTVVEKCILESQRRKERYQAELAKKPKEIYISRYNPDNPLNGSSSWNKQQREDWNRLQKLNKSNNK